MLIFHPLSLEQPCDSLPQLSSCFSNIIFLLLLCEFSFPFSPSLIWGRNTSFISIKKKGTFSSFYILPPLATPTFSSPFFFSPLEQQGELFQQKRETGKVPHFCFFLDRRRVKARTKISRQTEAQTICRLGIFHLFF